MKKIIVYVIFLFALTGCSVLSTQMVDEPSTPETAQADTPNPASVHCLQEGNQLEIRTADDGSQSGICIFPDGNTCEEWAYYRGECSPTVIPNPTPAAPLTFVDSGQDLGMGDGASVVTGDVDGDGDFDVLISNTDTNSLLFINDGKGVLTPVGQQFKPSTGAAFGDLNGDQALDIFITEVTGNEVWINDGKGVFSLINQDLVSSESTSVALGDLDGDVDLDAFVTNWNGFPDQVFFNDGKGHFKDSGQQLGEWFGTAVSLGDVDQDGDLDALVANNGEKSDNAPVLWLNDGKGLFSDSKQRLGFTNAYAAVLGDLDGDGDLDAFIANSDHLGADPADKVWMNDGKGVFSDSGQKLDKSYSMTAAFGDLDGDGDLDVVTGLWKKGPQIWLNNGKGTFTESTTELDSKNISGIAIADMDADGDLDMVVSTNTWSWGDGKHRLWLNQLTP